MLFGFYFSQLSICNLHHRLALVAYAYRLISTTNELNEETAPNRTEMRGQKLFLQKPRFWSRFSKTGPGTWTRTVHGSNKIHMVDSHV